MQQDDLWHDTPEDALRAVVSACGGPKKVGHDLWPAKTVADAAHYLNHCLDPERAEKLSLGEIMLLLKKGRQADCHTAIAFITRACHYEDTKPVEPEDEKVAIQHEVLTIGKDLRRMLTRLESIEGGE